uniref:Uncharacterized protein n=1 Tax=Picea glauca TaxID=3330 RepID=A0A101LVV4_PICGL|nr:hypothetical protein ABT39_MTgene1791 [Picea glauca]QHR86342.1 hypothetical protein Q903MT_gene341 [Picea sitchensis]
MIRCLRDMGYNVIPNMTQDPPSRPPSIRTRSQPSSPAPSQHAQATPATNVTPRNKKPHVDPRVDQVVAGMQNL